MSNKTHALFEYLKPLQPFLKDPLVSEISINEPQRIFVEKKGEMIEHQVEELSYYHLRGLVDLMARFYGHVLNEQSPLLSATLPKGHRIQAVIPPACEQNKIILSIRKTVTHHMTLDEFESTGAFELTQPYYIKQFQKNAFKEDNKELIELFQNFNYVSFLKQAILLKKNIIVSGGMSSGKTTLLNACLQEIPAEERIITLEDVREIKLPHQNVVHLLASHVNLQQLVEVSLRLRPDRIIIGAVKSLIFVTRIKQDTGAQLPVFMQSIQDRCLTDWCN